MKKDFLNYIHYFRGLAILFILGLHTCISLSWGDHQFERKIMLVLFNNGTVLFVFISGFLFYHLNQYKFDYGDYLKKKALYVVLPYLVVSVPAILDKLYIDSTGDHWWLTNAFAEKSIFEKVFIMLVTGRHMGMFWFIPMICIIYVISPLLIRFARTRAFLYIAPAIVIAGLFTFRFGYYSNIFLSLEYFLPVYIFGMWIYRIKEHLFSYNKQVIAVLSILFLLLTLCEIMEWIPFSEYIGFRDVGYPVLKFNPNKFKMHLFAVLMITTFYVWTTRQFNVLKLLGDYSFGIFFIHLYVIELINKTDAKSIAVIAPLEMVKFIPYFVVICTLCTLVVRGVKLVLGKNSRYLLGS